MRYNVRLEFDPAEPIGTLDLSPHLKSGHVVTVIDRGSLGAEPHDFVLDFFNDSTRDIVELAIRSDKPIEFWRRVEGFEERKLQ